MHFLATADTDIGISRKKNQDSALVKHARGTEGEVLLAMVCDGMGGLVKGELASAAVVRRFEKWFDEELPKKLRPLDMKRIGARWTELLKDINDKIQRYGEETGACLGTTFTGILFVDNQYLIGHVGDTRTYHLGHNVKQLTEDQTLVAQEVRRGNLTPQQAAADSRRNVLLQCIGASRTVSPQIKYGTVERGIYLLCSDGLWHELTEEELLETLNPHRLQRKHAMHAAAQFLFHLVKRRQEQDNITAVLVRAE